MRKLGLWRILFIPLVIAIATYSLAFQNINVDLPGIQFQRGSDAILGMHLGLDLQGGSHLVYQARGTKELTITLEKPASDLNAVEDVFNKIGKTGASARHGDLDKVIIVTVDTMNPSVVDATGNILREDDQDIIKNALME